MKRIRTYNQFRESRVNEEFIGKLWRKITGADAKDIRELTDKIKSEYDKYSEEGKKKFKWNLETYVNYNRLDDLYKNILDSDEWYGDLSKFVKPNVGGSIEKIKSDMKGILTHLEDKADDINSEVKKDSLQKRVSDINKKIDKYSQIINDIPNFNNDDFIHDFEAILKFIPGSPYSDINFFGNSLSPTECFVKHFSVYNKDKEFIKSDAFLKLVEKFRERNSIITETGVLGIKKEIDKELDEFFNDEELKNSRSDLQTKPNNIILYQDYQKAIEWVKEELVGKTVSDVLISIIGEKIVVIEKSDSKETKEGDKLVAGNIVYSGQNFNNLNLDNISKFINKEGYKESYSGKGMFTTNNIPYAFYYCHLRFGLEGKKISETLFPTIYKITLKPGSKFFYKGTSGSSDVELKSALICGVSGFHSGNKIVNNQSVEISIFTKECIENIEAIKPEELITYLDSPQCKSDNDRWIETDRFRTTDVEIRWYKGLVSSLKK
jgi:hypothetical protein